jgi:putative dimethyl sulfoxide reductase chaperone
MSEQCATGVPVALLLARWWSRPTPEELGAWAQLWAEAHEAEVALELEPGQVEQLRTAVAAADAQVLLDEYERLLVGPGRAPCAPYESIWSADGASPDAGTLMGAAADAVSGVYRELGLELRGDAHELPDHLVVEWEALAYALEHDATEAATELLSEHLARWMGPFCEAVRLQTAEPVYHLLATITPAWTAALAA